MSTLEVVDGRDLPALHRPIAVFDAGIGSYAAVAALRTRLPEQDILYLADRASFPYGAKTRADLLAILRRTLRALDIFAPAAILVASNAPSVTVLDETIDGIATPVFGVRPPVREALRLAEGRDVAILGVTSLIESPAFTAFVAREAGADADRIKGVDASSLVELVESGLFLSDPVETQERVSRYVAALALANACLGCLTLSSTHLPWLRTFFETARPDLPLLDPLDGVVDEIAPLAVRGTGRLLSLVTASEAYGVAAFRGMLGRLGVELDLYEVRF